MVTGRAARLWARLTHVGCVGLAAGADFLAPELRYGHFRTMTKLALRRAAVATVPAPADDGAVDVQARDGRPRVVLATAGLDSGGVEAVVELLARRLPEHGVAVDVLCASGGRVAEFLKGSGTRVVEAAGRAQADAALRALHPDVVQLHSAPGPILEAARAHGAPVVPVVHTTELFRSAADWALQSELAQVAFATVAVSAFVGRQHLDHLQRPPAGPLVVIPNGVQAGTVAGAVERSAARRQVGAALGVDLGDDTLALALARWDPQKNLPGLVAGFLEAAARRPSLRLVVAGRVEDWLELRKTDALRRASRVGDRVHLLAGSHAPTLLAAGDVFVLDSFFEGWPVAATEAAVSGLPLVLAEFGGAVELVGEAARRGVLVPNPAAAGGNVDAGSMRAARRAFRQRNRRELVAAILAVHDDVGHWRSVRDDLARTAAVELDAGPMVAAHADVLLRAARAGLR